MPIGPLMSGASPTRATTDQQKMLVVEDDPAIADSRYRPLRDFLVVFFAVGRFAAFLMGEDFF
jgi:hypothetical protein